jgi:pyridoxal phosphate enzyme (YggS family)
MISKYHDVLDRIQSICRACGRDPREIRLIAVSKTHPPESIRQIYGYGHREFGENYADELEQKFNALSDLKDLNLIFIGQLQSNKIQKIVRHAAEIQSIATEKHARYVNRYAKEFGKYNYPVWIVVNAGDESSKQGTNISEVDRLAKFIQSECPQLLLKGIMAIPPAIYQDSWLMEKPGTIPTLYSDLKNLANSTGTGLLSLGMSGDLELAIRAGSQVIRIGSAIFGSRH